MHFFSLSRLSSRTVAVALVAMVGLSACEQVSNSPKQTAGTVLGGLGGAVVGAQFGKGTGKIAATAAGTLLGAFLGSEIGSSLDRADKLEAEKAQQRAMTAPVGETIRWDNPESGHSGTITPVRDGRSNSGSYCREYKSTIYVDGRQEQAVGRACQQADGTWQIVQ